MPFYNASIYKEDGSVCCQGVMVSLDGMDQAGAAGWMGTISAKEGVELLAGRRYRLVLTDGRAGEFMVRRNTSAGGEDRAVSLQGMGPMR